MKKIITILALIMSIISISQVQRATRISKDLELESFSTEDEKFSGDYDLIVPKILIKKGKRPLLMIQFFEIGKLHGFRKIKISNGENEVILNVADGESKFTLIGSDDAEFVAKIIGTKDVENLLEMIRSEKQMKVDFVNKRDEVITKEVTEKEKEILKWTILNYIYKLKHMK